MSWHDGLPPSFVCVLCGRTTHPDRWHWKTEHKPPICRSCGNARGHQVRIVGMTRGDHKQMQRLRAVTDALIGASAMIEWETLHGRIHTSV